ncbi:unnamed protein product, partial [Rotaria sordida]
NSFKVNNNYVQIYDTTLDENIGLNKCLWSHNGQQIILGDDQGGAPDTINPFVDERVSCYEKLEQLKDLYFQAITYMKRYGRRKSI